MSLVDSLRQFGAEVRRLFVKAKPMERAKTEQIDLLKDRLEAEFSLQAGGDSRFPQSDRWNALREQYRDWRDGGDLPTRSDLAA
jgi:hypothetical protein